MTWQLGIFCKDDFQHIVAGYTLQLTLSYSLHSFAR
jgi:hypothetical protein